MEEFIPFTILPGVGMPILSTASQMMTLSSELWQILSGQCSGFEHTLADQKIHQLGLLTRAATLLYLTAGCYVLSGLVGAVLPASEGMNWHICILYGGTLLMLAAFFLYAFRAVSIRKMQHQHNYQLFEEKNVLKTKSL